MVAAIKERVTQADLQKYKLKLTFTGFIGVHVFGWLIKKKFPMLCPRSEPFFSSQTQTTLRSLRVKNSQNSFMFSKMINVAALQ